MIREGWRATRGLHLDSKTRRLWLCTGTPRHLRSFFTLSFSGLLAKKSEWQHDMNALSASGGSRSVYSNLKGGGFSTPADCENCYYLSQRRSAFTCVQSFVCLCVCWLVCERDCTYWFPRNLDGLSLKCLFSVADPDKGTDPRIRVRCSGGLHLWISTLALILDVVSLFNALSLGSHLCDTIPRYISDGVKTVISSGLLIIVAHFWMF